VIAEDLRHWRTRRRISQLELALRAGTTQRHVSFIERGRSVPGRAMVIRLAEALEVPLRERNALLNEAGYAAAYSETPLATLGPVRRALERVLDGHLPYPAVLVDRQAHLVGANAAFAVLTDGSAPHLLAPPVHVPRLLLHPEGLARRIVNLDEWGRHVIDALARRGDDTSELQALLPRPAAPGPDHIGNAVPLRLRDPELTLLTTLTHFGTADDVTVAELSLEAFLPADEATERVLLAYSPRHGLLDRPRRRH
jgi:transcriptional regulator with XRE-family HTH domain